MKEYKWNVELDGTTHRLLAVFDKRGSGYHLYDGDDYIANILPAKPFAKNIGIDQEFEIDGHTLRFVEFVKYDPDIVHNGRMINSDRDYTEAAAGHCKIKLFTYGIIMMCIIVIAVRYGIQSKYSDIAFAALLGLFVLYKMIKYARGIPKRSNK